MRLLNGQLRRSEPVSSSSPAPPVRRPLRLPTAAAAVLLCLLLPTACADGETAAESEDLPSVPQDTEPPASGPTPAPGPARGDWEIALPRAVGMDEATLSGILQRIGRQRGTEELLVIREDKIVAESTFRGGRPGRTHNIKSASKSVLSALVGIALEQGLFESLDQPVAELLPEAFEGLDERRREITLGHLLTMTTGLASTSGDAYGAWVRSPDWVRAALEMPRETSPGRQFTYSTGNTHLLSAALDAAAREKNGQGIRAFAEEHLFEPLGFEVSSWETDPQGLPLGGNQMATTARDLARLGELYLERGRWNGEQLVSASWIEESTSRHADGWPDRYGAYGYLWWLPPTDRDAYMAVGYGGQFLYVDPTTDTIIVLFSTGSGKGEEWDRQVLGMFREITKLG